MPTLDPLGLPFAGEALRRFQLPCIRAPVINVEMFNPKRLQELFQRHRQLNGSLPNMTTT
jgi:hypothetical protein